IRFANDLAALVEEHGLRRRRAAVEPDDAAHDLPGRELHRDEARDRIELLEVAHLVLGLHERRPRALAEARLPAVGHVLAEPGRAAIEADVRRLPQAVNASAEGGVVLRVAGDEDGLFNRPILGPRVAALFPGRRDPEAPALLEEGQVRVRSAE